jgi:hypothetical protein
LTIPDIVTVRGSRAYANDLELQEYDVIRIYGRDGFR